MAGSDRHRNSSSWRTDNGAGPDWPIQVARRFGVRLQELADLSTHSKLHTHFYYLDNYLVANQLSSAVKQSRLRFTSAGTVLLNKIEFAHKHYL